MKKWIFIVIVAGMLGYAIFDFWYDNKEEANKVEATDEARQLVEGSVNAAEVEEFMIGINVGDQAPDFALETLTGESVKLSDYRGKRVMLNFWATWCPPCRAEMPDMEEFYQDKDVVVLAVNLTDTETSVENVQNFKEEYELTFPIVMDDDLEVAELYAIAPIPTSYMIDSNGIISNKVLGAMNYELMIQSFENME